MFPPYFVSSFPEIGYSYSVVTARFFDYFAVNFLDINQTDLRSIHSSCRLQFAWYLRRLWTGLRICPCWRKVSKFSLNTFVTWVVQLASFAYPPLAWLYMPHHSAVQTSKTHPKFRLRPLTWPSSYLRLRLGLYFRLMESPFGPSDTPKKPHPNSDHLGSLPRTTPQSPSKRDQHIAFSEGCRKRTAFGASKNASTPDFSTVQRLPAALGTPRSTLTTFSGRSSHCWKRRRLRVAGFQRLRHRLNFRSVYSYTQVLSVVHAL